MQYGFVVNKLCKRIEISILLITDDHFFENKTVLLLSDMNTATIITLMISLQGSGLTVYYISYGIANYTGIPDAATYGGIILLTGDSISTDMPMDGQLSIYSVQQTNGTGIVLTEFVAYQVLSGG